MEKRTVLLTCGILAAYVTLVSVDSRPALSQQRPQNDRWPRTRPLPVSSDDARGGVAVNPTADTNNDLASSGGSAAQPSGTAAGVQPLWRYWDASKTRELPPEAAAVRAAVLSAQPRADVGRYIVFDNQNRQDGFNNKRELLHLAVILAATLNRTLVIDDYGTSIHDGKHVTTKPMSDFWELADLKKIVPVVSGAQFAALKKGMPVKLPLSSTIGLRLSELVARFGASAPSAPAVVSVPLRYGYPSVVLRQTAQDQRLTDNVIRYALHFQSGLFKVAQTVAEALQRNGIGFIAMHLRAGDRRPQALANCSEFGLRESKPRTECFCVQKGNSGKERPLVPSDVLLQQWKPLQQNKPPVYLATNAMSDPRVKAQVDAMQAAGFDTYTLGTVLPLLTEPDRNTVARLSGTQTSCVEQIICALSTKYIAHFPSSWDEWVMPMRRYMNQPGAAEQQALFVAKVTCKFGSQTRSLS